MPDLKVLPRCSGQTVLKAYKLESTQRTVKTSKQMVQVDPTSISAIAQTTNAETTHMIDRLCKDPRMKEEDDAA